MNLARSTPSYVEFEEEDIRDIIVRSYTIVGSLNGVGQSTLQVEAREAIIPDRQMTDYCVRLELDSGGDYPQQSFASINYNEIDRLIVIINKLQTTNITTDRFSFSEVQYEISNFKIIVFNTARGSMMVALTSGSVTVHLPSPSKLSELSDLINRAKSHLDQHMMG